MKKVKAFLQRLGGAWKLLTAACIGIFSLAANAWLVLTVKNWSGQHWYNPTQDIVTSGAATAAILIAIFIYSPEVVKVLAETFLNKRFQAGQTVGEARKEAQILKFIEEHPEATAEEVREFIRQSRNRNGRSGKTE